MPRAEPGKKSEARRLVEEEKYSLAAAADQVEVNRGTVRAWQKADEEAGDPWQLYGLSAAQKERQAGMTAEDRMAQTERARQSTASWRKTRRSAEAEYFGTLTGGVRMTAAEALTKARTAIANSDADETVKWARALRDFAVVGGIWADKADKLADIPGSSTVVAVGTDETFHDDVASVLSLVDRIERDRRAG